jgi:hypothetical protein
MSSSLFVCDAENTLALAAQAVFHEDAAAKHELWRWRPHRHEVNPCSAVARLNACKLPKVLPKPHSDQFTAVSAQLQACWGLFAPASTADGDWLGTDGIGEMDKGGQSVKQYAAVKLPKLRLTPARSTIYLVPFGDVSRAPSFELLSRCVRVFLGLDVKQGTPVALQSEMSKIDISRPGTG